MRLLYRHLKARVVTLVVRPCGLCLPSELASRAVGQRLWFACELHWLRPAWEGVTCGWTAESMSPKCRASRPVRAEGQGSEAAGPCLPFFLPWEHVYGAPEGH